MKNLVTFGLAAVVGASSLASAQTSNQENDQISQREMQSNNTVEIVLDVPPAQRAQLLRVLEMLNIQVKDWRSIEEHEVPSRCC